MSLLLTQLKCTNCQGDLDINEAKNGVIICKYCNSSFTVPKHEAAESVIDLLKEAERDLDKGRFEDAYQMYQKAAEQDEEEPEAYFGMALANAKVQYLNSLREDENTKEVKKCLQPICYEVINKKFTEDKNYKKALDLATPEQKKVYYQKGTEIDDIRNKFNELKSSGVSYDCFICTKVSEVDNKKRHTEDYFEAEKLYKALKEAGFNPFFSEEVLNKNLGVDYEAYILYALYSSPCMIIVCLDESYLHTQWVQNEYTRFLQMIKNEEKHLNSITFAFKNGKIIERLPGVSGKIQGIALDEFDAKDKIISFVGKYSESKNRIPDIDRKEYGKINVEKKNVIEQQIKKRDLKIERNGVVSASDHAQIGTLQNFLDEEDYVTASSMAESLIKERPKLSAAYWILELADTRCQNVQQYIAKKRALYDFDNIEKAISTESDPAKRAVYYDALYSRVKYHKHLREFEEYISLPESSPAKISELADIMYREALDTKDEETFKSVLKTITNTDKYIKMNREFLSKVPKSRNLCYANILEVDKSDKEALYENFAIKNLSNKKELPEFLKNEKNFDVLEKEVYSYGFNDYATSKIFAQVIDLVKAEKDEQASKIFDFVLKMIPKKQDTLFIDYLQQFIDNLLGLAEAKRKPNFEMADSYNDLLLQTDVHNYDAYFNKFLIKRRIGNLLELVHLTDFISRDKDYLDAITQFNEVHPEKQNANKYMIFKKTIDQYSKLLSKPEEFDDVIKHLRPSKTEIFNYSAQIQKAIDDYHMRETNKFMESRRNEIQELEEKVQKLYRDFCKKHKLPDESYVFSIKKNVSQDPILFEIRDVATKLSEIGIKKELLKVNQIIDRQKEFAHRKRKRLATKVVCSILLIISLLCSAVLLFIPVCGYLGYNSAFYIVSVGIFESNFFLLLYMLLGVLLIILDIIMIQNVRGVGSIFKMLIPLVICVAVIGLSYVYKNNTTSVYYDDAIIARMDKNDSGYTIRSLGTLKGFDGELVLPETYRGKPVTAVGKKFNNGIRTKTIKKLIIPESYTAISSKAFYWNDKINEIYIGNNVTEIGKQAFDRCSQLTVLSIGDGVETMQFRAKRKLIGGYNYTFKNCKKLSVIYFGNGLTEIDDYAFEGNNSLQEVYFGNGLTSIGKSSFSNCRNLKTVQFGNSLTGIGEGAFEFCESLETVDLSTVSSTFVIGDKAFRSCGNLSKVLLGNVTNIGQSAFEHSKSLKTIRIPSSVTIIGDDAFNFSGLETAYITGEWITGSGLMMNTYTNFNKLSPEDAAEKLKMCSGWKRT